MPWRACQAGCRCASQGRAWAGTQAWSSRGVDEWDPCDNERGRGGTELGREKGAGPAVGLCRAEKKREGEEGGLGRVGNEGEKKKFLLFLIETNKFNINSNSI